MNHRPIQAYGVNIDVAKKMCQSNANKGTDGYIGWLSHPVSLRREREKCRVVGTNLSKILPI